MNMNNTVNKYFGAEKMELELTLIRNSRAKIMWNIF